MGTDKASGPEITRRIKRNLPSVAIILTAEKKEEEKLFEAIKSGASACLTKDTDPKQLLDTIRVVAQGNLPILDELLLPGLAAMVITEFEVLAALNEQVDNLLAGLAPKESQVLSTIAAGNNLEQIAAKLEMNEETIRCHLRLVLNKLVTNDQARAVIEAAQRSLPSIIRGPTKRDGKPVEYVTRAEFNDFKENLMESLKSFIGQLT